MKNYKLSSTLYYISSILFYISAILCFVDKNPSMGVVWLCLGSTNLCLGSNYTNKAKENNDDTNKID